MLSCLKEFNFIGGGDLSVSLFCALYKGPYGKITGVLKCVNPAVVIPDNASEEEVMGQFLQVINFPIEGGLSTFAALCFACGYTDQPIVL